MINIKHFFQLTSDPIADIPLSLGYKTISKSTHTPRQTNTTSDPIINTENKQSNM